MLDKLEALKPAHIVPSHGAMGDATLIADQRTMLQQIQARTKELKAQGRSADDAAATVTAECQAKYPDWSTPNRVGAAARSFYNEAK